MSLANTSRIVYVGDFYVLLLFFVPTANPPYYAQDSVPFVQQSVHPCVAVVPLSL